MSIKVVGIDIAKKLFQVCVLSSDGQILSNRKVKRGKLLDVVRQLPEQKLLRWNHAQLRIIGEEYFRFWPDFDSGTN